MLMARGPGKRPESIPTNGRDGIQSTGTCVLCKFCRKLASFLSTCGELHRFEDIVKDTTFEDSAIYCSLCAKIDEELRANQLTPQHAVGGKTDTRSSGTLRRTTLPWLFQAIKGTVRRSGRSVRTSEVRLDGCGVELRFAIWAEEDTPAQATVVNRPPIYEDLSEASFQLVHDWMKDCEQHAECKYDLFNVLYHDLPVLPTRILEISAQPPQRPKVRLVESLGRSGRYFALSHCWGNSPLLKTTRENYEQHQTNVPFDSLPKTFCDAVDFAQGMVIPYLWIDSLCIIQDDVDDWMGEAKLMGGVYGKATLVLAAAGADDSSQGLFFCARHARPPEGPISLPYSPVDLQKGTFSIALISHLGSETWGPNCPLRKRAWTFQESFLARRTVSFMPGGISWSCRQLTLLERGEAMNVSQHFSQWSWLSILEHYCERRLTVSSDRLIAIQGVIDALQCRGRKMFHFGVCADDDVIEQLLWRVDETCELGTCNAPSWSWAASECRKRWYAWHHYRNHYRPGEQDIDVLYHTLELSSQGSLHASGRLLKADFSPTSLARCCRAALCQGYNSSRLEDWILGRGDIFREPPERNEFDVHLVVKMNSEAVDGFAVFDQARVESAVCFLATATRREHTIEALHPDMSERSDDIGLNSDGLDADHSQEANAVQGCSSHSGKCLDLRTFAISDRVYHAMLLEKVNEGKFKRVGVALLYPSALERKDEMSKNAEFEII